MLAGLKKIYRKIKKIVQWQKFAFKNHQKPVPVYSNSNDDRIKLHIGSGAINIQGWVNIDARKFEHTHLVSEGFELKEFSDSAVGEIYLCHVLEHFSYFEGEELLKQFRSKIANGGVIRISVPDFDALITAYNENDNDMDSIKGPLMGGQDYEYNFHKATFNQDSLKKLLEKCGFSDVSSWDTLTDFGVGLGDWSNGTISAGEKRIPVSLNLKARNVL